METGKRKLDDQILQLRKGLKKKSYVEIWERVFQFYHNHYATISNFQIIRLIKISLRPLKAIIKADLRRLNKIDLDIMNAGPTTSSLRKTRMEIASNIIHNFLILEKTFLSYTIILQAYFETTEDHFFSFFFQNRFELSPFFQDIPFEPKANRDEPTLTPQRMEHELHNFLAFFCNFQLLFLQINSHLGNFSYKNRVLESVQNFIHQISYTSYQFSFKKIEFELIKMKILKDYQNRFNESSLPTQVNASVPYRFPIQCIQVLEYYKKRNCLPALHSKLKILSRYCLTLISRGQKSIRLVDGTKFQSEIFILIQAILLYEPKEGFTEQNDELIFQFFRSISAWLQRYLLEQAQLVEIIRKFTSLEKYRTYNFCEGSQKDNKQKLKEPEKKQDKQTLQKPKIADNASTSAPIDNFAILRNIINHFSEEKENYSNKILEGLNWDFNMVIESDSDENGQMHHAFEGERRKELNVQNYGKNSRLPKINKSTFLKEIENSEEVGYGNGSKQIMKYKDVHEKLLSLEKGIEEMKRKQKMAIKNLKQFGNTEQELKKVRSLDKTLQKRLNKVTDAETKINPFAPLKNQYRKQEPKKKKTFLKIERDKKQDVSSKKEKKSPLMMDFKQKFSQMSRRLMLANTYIHTSNL